MYRRTLLIGLSLIMTVATYGADAEKQCPGKDPQAQCCPCHILKNPSKITAELLQKATLVEIEESGRRFTPIEVTLLIDYLKHGGAVFLLMDEESRTPLLDDGVSLITAPFGITFTKDLEYLHNCGGIAKAGVINKEDREIPFSGGRAVTGGTPFAWRLDAKGHPAEPFATYVEIENGGRLVALSEKMAYLGLGVPSGIRLSGVPNDPSRTTYWGKDAKTFTDEIRCWLMCKTPAK